MYNEEWLLNKTQQLKLDRCSGFGLFLCIETDRQQFWEFKAQQLKWGSLIEWYKQKDKRFLATFWPFYLVRLQKRMSRNSPDHYNLW